MDFLYLLFALILFITSQITMSIEPSLRVFIQEYGGIGLCKNTYRHSMDIESFYFVDSGECPLEKEFFKVMVKDGSHWDKTVSACNGTDGCDFTDLPRDDPLRGCVIDISYNCLNKADNTHGERKPSNCQIKTRPNECKVETKVPTETRELSVRTSTNPPQTTTRLKSSSSTTPDDSGHEGNRKKNGSKKKNANDDSDDHSNSKSEMMRMIFLIAIAVSIIAFLAIIIIVVLCGLFVCGWSSKFEQWNNTRLGRARQQQQQQTHTDATPLDEYAYIDENALLSNSTISTTTPSPGQHSEAQLRWKTPDTCDGPNKATVTRPQPHSAPDDFDDYAEVEDNNKSAVSPKASGVKKPSFGVAMPGYPEDVDILPPWPAPPGNTADLSYKNHLDSSQSVRNKSHAQPLSSKMEPVEYSLPIPRSERPTVKTRPNAFQTAREETNWEEKRSPEHKQFTRNFSHPGKRVAPSPLLPCLPVPGDIPSRSATTAEHSMPSARRASLPRHSKLMENQADIDVWISSGQASSENHCISQPSLVEQGTSQLYSHLGSQQVVSVVGNVYHG